MRWTVAFVDVGSSHGVRERSGPHRGPNRAAAMLSVTVRAGGRFRFDGLVVVDYLDDAHDRVRSLDAPRRVTVTREANTLDLRLAEGCTLQGRASDVDGSPATDVEAEPVRVSLVDIGHEVTADLLARRGAVLSGEVALPEVHAAGVVRIELVAPTAPVRPETSSTKPRSPDAKPASPSPSRPSVPVGTTYA